MVSLAVITGSFRPYAFAQRRGTFTDSRIVLAGVALGYVAMAVTSFIQLQADPGALRGILFWSMGSVSGGRWPMLALPLIVLVVIGGWLSTQGRTMNAVALGDDDAIAVGVNLRLTRIGLLIAASALTAVAVFVAGGIGFVGLIVPHVMRLLCGADHRLLLPISALGRGAARSRRRGRPSPPRRRVRTTARWDATG